MCVFVDQAVEDRFSADLLYVDVSYGGAVRVTFVAGDALGDALVCSRWLRELMVAEIGGPCRLQDH